MVDRIALYRPLSGVTLHPDVEVKSGSDTRSLNGPGDITFSVSPAWHDALADDGSKIFGKRQTLVVVERANGTIRQVGLVDDLDLAEDALNVSCGGFSMIIGQSGPWEGHQGYYVTMDPVTLFRRVVEQAQNYANADLGVRVVGSTRSGGTLGEPGSAAWQDANRQLQQYKPRLDAAEAHLQNAERVLSQRIERLFRAATLKRVGTIHQQENAPDNPHVQRDSTIWVNNAWRAHVYHQGTGWVQQSQADEQVQAWRNGVATRDRARDRVEYLRYRAEPLQKRVDELEEAGEGKESFSLYFWQNHDLGTVIEQLTELGPFEFREEAAWSGDDLDLRIRVGAPRVGVRRPELYLELGVNVHDMPVLEHGDLYTGVALFGAGEGSEVLSAQRSWNPKHAVRNILTETDKDAHTKQLTNAAANKLLDRVKADAGVKYTDLVIQHDTACPEGSFEVGDELYVTGNLASGARLDGWVRVLEASHEWGSNTTSIEVEQL